MARDVEGLWKESRIFWDVNLKISVMIFVTVGTQANGFLRCLNAVEQLIIKYNIQEDVIAQIGYSKFSSSKIKCVPFMSEKMFIDHIKAASVVISHAGSGALFNAIKYNKKIIAVARLYEYNEMPDNHQLELLNKLVDEGYILDGTSSLDSAWEKVDSFIPRKNDFKNNIVEVLNKWISDWINN